MSHVISVSTAPTFQDADLSLSSCFCSRILSVLLVMGDDDSTGSKQAANPPPYIQPIPLLRPLNLSFPCIKIPTTSPRLLHSIDKIVPVTDDVPQIVIEEGYEGK